jgi:hypothetical protein
MKKTFFFLLVAFWVSNACAQNFPLSRRLAWDPNPPTDNVTQYVATADGELINLLASACSATECSVPVTITTPGSHVYSVYAVNEWAQGDPTTITVMVNKPGKINNPKIK